MATNAHSAVRITQSAAVRHKAPARISGRSGFDETKESVYLNVDTPDASRYNAMSKKKRRSDILPSFVYSNFGFSLLAIVGKAVANRISMDAQNITERIFFSRFSPPYRVI